MDWPNKYYSEEDLFKRKDYLKNHIEEKYGSTEEFNKQISVIRKQSFLDKYGVENPSQIDFVKEKVKNSSIKTFRDKYGVDYSVLLLFYTILVRLCIFLQLYSYYY